MHTCTYIMLSTNFILTKYVCIQKLIHATLEYLDYEENRKQKTRKQL